MTTQGTSGRVEFVLPLEAEERYDQALQQGDEQQALNIALQMGTVPDLVDDDEHEATVQRAAPMVAPQAAQGDQGDVRSPILFQSLGDHGLYQDD